MSTGVEVVAGESRIMDSNDFLLNEPKAAICGTGDAAAILWEALCLHGGVEVVGFFSERLRESYARFRGLPVVRPTDIGVLAVDLYFVSSEHWPVWRERFTETDLGPNRWRIVPTEGGVSTALECLVQLLPALPKPVEKPASFPLRVGIFGTGQGGAKVWEALLDHDDVQVVWFADNDPNKHGTRYLWAEVIAPDASMPSADFTIIASMYRKEILEQLLALGVSRDRVLEAEVTGTQARIGDQLRVLLDRARKEVGHAQ